MEGIVQLNKDKNKTEIIIKGMSIDDVVTNYKIEDEKLILTIPLTDIKLNSKFNPNQRGKLPMQ